MERSLYTTTALGYWQVYSDLIALFRGGGDTSDPKLFGPKGLRGRDFHIIYDVQEKMEFVEPNIINGSFFSDSIQRLQKIPVKCVVWRLPKGKELPKGLVINYPSKDHPLIKVEYRMSGLDLMAKLKQLASMLEPTEMRIK